ncbi:MAG: glycoside hydrolase family 3 N-terminal domain-containing protein [Chitinophagaceae bacterium]
MKKLWIAFLITSSYYCVAQQNPRLSRQLWVDSVFKSLTEDQRIAQLMVVRLSERNAGGVVWYDKEVTDNIKKYNIGSICLFQGNPVKQADMINAFQSIARTPLMICVDGEWGLGMRFDSVGSLPFQLTMGAMSDASLVYKVGKAMGEQCKRIGIHVNYAPVVDINNNPDNPVINFRSFGEDKYKVGSYGVQIMKGLQDMGVMACAKHFPGHGDVAVDSHFDLPVIKKNIPQLDSLELYPFREAFKAGIGSVMIAHLYIPAIDATANRASSLSYNNITKLLKENLAYQGLIFTDALEMQGVRKFFPDGAASVESIIAGNDMLCLPGNIPGSIAKIREAIKNKRLSWADINTKVKRVLNAKYTYVLPNIKPINTAYLTRDINNKIPDLRRLVADNAITLVRNGDPAVFPLPVSQNNKIAYVGIGISGDNAFAKRMRSDYNADIYYFDYKSSTARILSLMEILKKRYDAVVVGVHNYSRYPANNFGISQAAVQLMNNIRQETKSMTLFFGNPYALKNVCDAKNVMVCYEDDAIFQDAAIRILQGLQKPVGRLPVTVCEAFTFGTGIIGTNDIPSVQPATLSFNETKLNRIDSIVHSAILNKATPGCVVLVAKDGKIAYQRSFGYYTYDSLEAVSQESVFDMASVTKIFATTLAVMKLHEEGRLDVKKKLGDYLSWVKGSDKENLPIEDILLHQAGLKSFIPFYKETIDSSRGGLALYTMYSATSVHSHSIRVAEEMYMRNDWLDTMYKRILQSELGPPQHYVYSDNDFIFLGKVVEAITGTTLDQYVKQEFYDRLNLTSTGFKPRERFPMNRIVPTEQEIAFRGQLLRGDVHDPGAAMFGGVAGHAGLFSKAYDLAVLAQMLLNGGSFNGRQLLKNNTINTFTAYHSPVSRRGFGFDKPEKDNASRKDPYPCLSASPLTYGHTGYTGTCVWIDPKYNLIFVFLSNRVNPLGGENTKLLRMNVRANIQETIYKALGL